MRHMAGRPFGAAEKLTVALAFALALSWTGTALAGAAQSCGAGDRAGETAATDNLRSLIQEALAHSPLIVAARRRWEARRWVPIQAATLPDPQVGVQSFSVGNPLPGNDLQTNNFAYFGYGVSQEIPFPTKLRLKASIAREQAKSGREAYRAQQRAVVEQVRETYFNLCYLDDSLRLLARTRGDLGQIARFAESRYRLGTASQQDVLKAQLAATSILGEEQTAREELTQGQADLKAIVGRGQDSPDIAVGALAPSRFTITPGALRALALENSPVLKEAESREAGNEQALKLAREGYIPDLSVSYMYEKTGAKFPDNYMATLGLKIPLYFWRKQTPAIEQAALQKDAARAQSRAARLSVAARIQNQWIAIQTTRRVIGIYRDGLIPQAQAAFKSALTAYGTGKVDFQTLLSARIDVLRLGQQLDRAIADHEIAIAKTRQIIGGTL